MLLPRPRVYPLLSYLHGFFQVDFRAPSIILKIKYFKKLYQYFRISISCVSFVSDPAVSETKAVSPNLVHVHWIFMACT